MTFDMLTEGMKNGRLQQKIFYLTNEPLNITDAHYANRSYIAFAFAYAAPRGEKPKSFALMFKRVSESWEFAVVSRNGLPAIDGWDHRHDGPYYYPWVQGWLKKNPGLLAIGAFGAGQRVR